MKIILNKDVKNLGEEGNVCEVKDGYARNFLLPQGFAVPYNRLNVNNFKAKAAAIALRKEQKRQQALGLKERLEKEVLLEIVMPSADGGRLFGAVSNATIAEQLAHQGINLERKRIEVPGRSIKVIGNYTAKVRLYDGETAALKVIVRSLEAQKKAEKEAEEAALGAQEAEAAGQDGAVPAADEGAEATVELDKS